jgi:hypothetical protein
MLNFFNQISDLIFTNVSRKILKLFANQTEDDTNNKAITKTISLKVGMYN